MGREINAFLMWQQFSPPEIEACRYAPCGSDKVLIHYFLDYPSIGSINIIPSDECHLVCCPSRLCRLIYHQQPAVISAYISPALSVIRRLVGAPTIDERHACSLHAFYRDFDAEIHQSHAGLMPWWRQSINDWRCARVQNEATKQLDDGLTFITLDEQEIIKSCL